jgi:hypothetical protein
MRGVRELTIIVALVSIAAVLAGCGSDSSAAGNSNCKVRLVAAAEAGALARLYNDGKLGSAAQIRSESSKDHPFMTAGGKMISYARMTAWQRASFADWAASGRVDRLARHELEDADRLAVQQAKSRCT